MSDGSTHSASAQFDDDVARAATAIAAGEVIIIPTDTVYGLAADPHSQNAMRRMFELKMRPEGVPIASLAANREQAVSLVRPNAVFDQLAERHWPGPLTLVAERRPGLDVYDNANRTLGVRVADHRFVLALTTRLGPVAATSANLHGSPTITVASESAEVFGDRVEVIIDGGTLGNVASTVVDTTVDPAVVLRQGAVVI